MAMLTATDGTTYRLIPAHAREAHESPVAFLDERDAFGLLSQLAADEFNATALLRFAAEDADIPSLLTAGQPRVLAYLAANLAMGRFHLVVTGARRKPLWLGGRPAEPGETTEPDQEESPASTEKTWIKFEIVDDATGKPLSGVTLKVKLPDGTPRSGKSDASGIIEFRDIDPGTCEIERMLDGDTLEVVAVQ